MKSRDSSAHRVLEPGIARVEANMAKIPRKSRKSGQNPHISPKTPKIAENRENSAKNAENRPKTYIFGQKPKNSRKSADGVVFSAPGPSWYDFGEYP